MQRVFKNEKNHRAIADNADSDYSVGASLNPPALQLKKTSAEEDQQESAHENVTAQLMYASHNSNLQDNLTNNGSDTQTASLSPPPLLLRKKEDQNQDPAAELENSAAQFKSAGNNDSDTSENISNSDNQVAENQVQNSFDNGAVQLKEASDEINESEGSTSQLAYAGSSDLPPSPHKVVQRFGEGGLSPPQEKAPSQANNTGLPDNLKAGVEKLSGQSMDDVNVNYNSHKPAQLNAHAYAQGPNIEVAPGQEKHLPHEAWHVAQQKQGRVKPTKQMKGKVPINDDEGLEKEADVMGAKAMQFAAENSDLNAEFNPSSNNAISNTVQRIGGKDGVDEENEDGLFNDNGKWMLNLPPQMDSPIIRAEIKAEKLKEGRLQLENFQISLPGLIETELPATLIVEKREKSGLFAQATLTDEVVVGENVTLTHMVLTYEEGVPNLAGKALVQGIPGIEPMVAELGYSLGKGITLGAEITSKPIALPGDEPIVTGSIDGKIDFKNKSFDDSEFTGKLNIKVPGEEDFGEGVLDFQGEINNSLFDGEVILNTAKKVNSYLELKKLIIKIKGANLKGEGSFDVQEISEKIPLEMDSDGIDDSGLSSKKVGEDSSIFWGSVDYGIEWGKRGFFIEGKGNVKFAKGAIASGYLRFERGLGDEGGMESVLEVKRVPLIEKHTQKKSLIDKFEKRIPVYRLGGLGGIYAEAGADLNFDYEVGPVEMSADAKIKNIDLQDAKADFDPVNVHIHGSASAGISGTPWVGMGAWFLSSKLVNLSGGLKLPVSSRLKSNMNADLSNLKLKNGEFEGPDLTADMDLIFGMKGAVEPFAHIYALNGLLDYDLDFDSLLEISLISPRKVMELSLDLNKLKEGKDILPTIPESVEKAEEDQETTLEESTPEQTIPESFNASVKGEVAPGSFTTKTPDLSKIMKGIQSNEKLGKFVEYADYLTSMASKLSMSIDKLVEYLDQKGIVGQFKNNWNSLASFGKSLVGVESDKVDEFLEEKGLVGKAKVKKTQSDEGSNQDSGGTLFQELLFELGNADIRVQVEGSKGRILYNMLDRDGLHLDETVSLEKGDPGITSATLTGSLDLGEDFAALENINLKAKPKKKPGSTTFSIDPNFEADLKAKKELDKAVVGNLSGNVSGTFNNTQTKIQGINLNNTPAASLKMESPIDGQEIVSKETPALVFRKGFDEKWRVASQGLTFLNGNLEVTIEDYVHDEEKGVSGKGNVKLYVEPIGHALATLTMKEGKVESLAFYFVTKELALPKDDPILKGQVRGGFEINRQKIQKPKIIIDAALNHAAVNNGEPVEVEGTAQMRSTEDVGLEFNLKSTPVNLIEDMVTLKKFKMSYAKTKGAGLGADGNAILQLPGISDPVGIGVLYNSKKFSLSISNPIPIANCSINTLTLGHGTKGWFGKAGISFWNKIVNVDLSYDQPKGWEGSGEVAMGKEGDRLFLKGDAEYSQKTGLTFDVAASATLGPGVTAEGQVSYLEKEDEEGGKKKKDRPLKKALNAKLALKAPLLKEPNEAIDNTLFDIAYNFPVAVLPGSFFKVGAKLSYGLDLNALDLEGNVSLEGIDLKSKSFESAKANAELKGPATEKGITASLTAEPRMAVGWQAITESALKLEGGLKIPITATGTIKPKAKGTIRYGADGEWESGMMASFPLSFGIHGSAVPYIDLTAAWGLVTYKEDLPAFGPLEILKPKKFFDLSLNLGNIKDNDPSKMGPKKGAKLEDASESVDDKKEKKLKVDKALSTKDVTASDSAKSKNEFSFVDRAKVALNDGLSKYKEPLRKAKEYVKAVTHKVGKLAKMPGELVKSAYSNVANWISSKFKGDDGPERAYNSVKDADKIEDIDDYKGLFSYWNDAKEYWNNLSTSSKIGYTGLAIGILGAGLYFGSKFFGSE